MKRVGVLVHPTRAVEDALAALRGWTEAHGVELVQIQSGQQPSVAPPGEVSRCDLIAALGGDGTVLKALHASAKSEAPVLGIACGSLGALTTTPEDEIRAGLDRFAAGGWGARRLPALEVRAAGSDVRWAINDFVVVRRGGTQLGLDVHASGELYVRMAGDGVVVATALGSSAYSMAAGGALLTFDTGAYICTPLQMHGGCAPPLVLPADRGLTLQVHPSHGGFRVEIDGFEFATDANRFDLTCEQAYATLVDLGESRTGVPWLRQRGLIADSPRVIAQYGPASADGAPVAAPAAGTDNQGREVGGFQP